MGAGSSLKVYDSNPIGQGAFSTVYIGLYRKHLLDSNRPVAVKRLKFREDGDYCREGKVLLMLNHENIIRYFCRFRNDAATYDLVFELACIVTLAGALDRGNLGATWKRSTICQISAGVAYLHSRNVIHLNLTPSNILFKDRELQRVLICGFGMATRAPSSRHAGARNFQAPDAPFTMKSDVFSMASIACCVLAEQNPESPEETASIVSDVLRNHIFGFREALRLLLRKGVDERPQNRPSAKQFRDTFERYEESIPDWLFLTFVALLVYILKMVINDEKMLRTLRKWGKY